jgi:ParB-like chromosome segregation protein Spo0J
VLRDAIAADGLLSPPVVYLHGDSGRYRIVCGYRRLDALVRLGWSAVAAWIMPPAARSALLGCALRDNLSHRTLTVVEKAAAVVMLRACLSDSEIIETWLPRLGLRPAPASLTQAEAIRALEPEVQAGIEQGILTERAALRLAPLAAADRAALWNVLRGAHLSVSKQAELIEHCLDIARRDDCSIADVAGAEDIRALLNDARRSPAQRGEAVRRSIRRRRFPRLIGREQQFAAARSRLALPPHIVLQAPPGFEGDTYRIDISFSRPDQLQQAARHLDALAGHAALHGLLGERG